jgi:hypothetical protein
VRSGDSYFFQKSLAKDSLEMVLYFPYPTTQGFKDFFGWEKTGRWPYGPRIWEYWNIGISGLRGKFPPIF